MGQQSVSEQNEKKKQYLRKYRKCSKKIEKIEAEIEELRILKKYPASNNSGMPKARKKTDLSDFAADLDERERKLYEEGVAKVKTYKDIQYRIDQLTCEDEKDVMFYRYIKGLSFWEISQKMGYSERQIYRLHGKALVKINI